MNSIKSYFQMKSNNFELQTFQLHIKFIKFQLKSLKRMFKYFKIIYICISIDFSVVKTNPPSSKWEIALGVGGHQLTSSKIDYYCLLMKDNPLTAP